MEFTSRLGLQVKMEGVSVQEVVSIDKDVTKLKVVKQSRDNGFYILISGHLVQIVDEKNFNILIECVDRLKNINIRHIYFSRQGEILLVIINKNGENKLLV